MKVYKLMELCDPYEPSAVIGIYETLDIVPKTQKEEDVYIFVEKTRDGNIIWESLNTGVIMSRNEYAFPPNYYVEEDRVIMKKEKK